jgi:hypothetical protein
LTLEKLVPLCGLRLVEPAVSDSGVDETDEQDNEHG